MTVRTTVCFTPRRGSVPSRAARSAGTRYGPLSHGAGPSCGSGYQVSSVSPVSVTVASPTAQAVGLVAEPPVVPVASVGAFPVVTASVIRPILGAPHAPAQPPPGLRPGFARPRVEPMTKLDLGTDAVTLTRALCDIPSVSGEEDVIVSAVQDALAELGHLEVMRDGNVVVARTSLGRAERVVLA